MNIRKTFLLTLAGVLASTVSFSATLTVTSAADSGDGTLRAAITSLTNNSETTIFIPEGWTINLESQITLPSLASVTVKGQGKGATISGGGMGRLFYYNYDRRKDKIYRIHRFENLTLKDGSAENGGVLCTQQSAQNMCFEFVSCVITNNSATVCGGVVLSSGADDFLFDNCTIVSNSVTSTAKYEGGGSVIGGTSNSNTCYSNLVMRTCKLIGNRVSGQLPGAIVKGGGIGYSVISNCQFIANSSVQSGATAASGGLFNGLKNTAASTHVFIDCKFVDNTSTHTPGIMLGTMGMLAVTNCCFSGNTAPGYLFQFGSHRDYHRNVWGSFDGCLFETNSAALFSTVSGTNAWVSISRSLLRGNSTTVAEWILGYHGGVGGQLLMVRDTMIEGCKSSRGGLFSTSGRLSFESVTFTENGISNSALGESSGSAMYLVAGSVMTNVTFFANRLKYRGFIRVAGEGCEFVNCTVVSNVYATSYGIFNDSVGGYAVRNSVFIGNGVSRLGKAAANDPSVVSHCAVDFAQGTYPSDPGNIYSLAFADSGLGTALTDDRSKVSFYDGTKLMTLPIAKDSPLKDAGTVAVAYDARGLRRDATPDIGAYEYVLRPGLMILYQ